MNLRNAGPTVILVILAVFTTAFAFVNYGNTVRVWPLAGMQHLTLVIGVALVLGAGIGGLLSHLFRSGRSIRGESPQAAGTREPARKI